VKYARELIALAMKEVGAEKKESEKIDYVPDYESTEALVKRGLIKLLATDEVGTEVVNASFTDLAREKFKVVTGLDIRPSVSVEEAKEAVSDEIIEGLIIHEKDVFVHHGNKKGIVNIDSLSASFADGDVVDIIALKQKGLIAKNVGYVKVLARGTLNKALTVKAHEYSTTAVKMIMLVGGAVVEED
ncbi:MAG: uL15 family ribosomal protein, partial [Clostridia bacterium]|nr:uL15 family ribosomal protein [Clostridia bacterium]